MLDPPADISGNVSPLVGSTPMFTPMLMTGLQAEPDAEPGRAVGLKCKSCICCEPGYVTSAPHQQHESPSVTMTPSEAELLGEHGEHEVRVGFRQVEKLLHARTEPDAAKTATADGDQRLRELETGIEWIRPRIAETP